MSLLIAVLSYSDEFYTTRRLLEAGQAMGHRMVMLNPFGLSVETDDAGVSVYERDQAIDQPDAVIPRVGAVLTEWNLFIVETLIRGGAQSPATADSLAVAADKARCAVVLAQAGVPAVPTYVLREEAALESTLSRLDGQDLVVKLPHGTQGRTVVGIKQGDNAREPILAWIAQGHPVLVQPWIQMARPRDLRVMVVGHQAIGAIWRVAKAGEFRSNIHQGGRAEKADLSMEARSLAERAVQAIGLASGAVDLIETREGLAVLEINGCPGFRSFEETTGIDLASRWIAGFTDE